MGLAVRIARMPDLPPISRLEIVDVREVWRHEAHVFTPWLAANLDRLNEATGLQLEIEGTEAAAGSFSADILARDSQSGAMVIIENQLEGSDQSSFASTRSSIDSIRRHPSPSAATHRHLVPCGVQQGLGISGPRAP